MGGDIFVHCIRQQTYSQFILSVTFRIMQLLAMLSLQ